MRIRNDRNRTVTNCMNGWMDQIESNKMMFDIIYQVTLHGKIKWYEHFVCFVKQNKESGNNSNNSNNNNDKRAIHMKLCKMLKHERKISQKLHLKRFVDSCRPKILSESIVLCVCFFFFCIFRGRTFASSSSFDFQTILMFRTIELLFENLFGMQNEVVVCLKPRPR